MVNISCSKNLKVYIFCVRCIRRTNHRTFPMMFVCLSVRLSVWDGHALWSGAP